ncbi:hypothetical protein HDU92_004993, partial [Lobulomyces angularis]
MSTGLPSCLPLQGSTFCSQYAQYNINNLFGQSLTLPVANPTVSEFDSYMATSFSTTQNFATTIKTVLECPESTYNASNSRYFQSVYCALIVDASTKTFRCNENLPPPPLCKSTFDTFYNQFVRDIADPTNNGTTNKDVCNSTVPINTNQNILLSYITFSRSVAPDDNNCVKGSSIDLKQCGFPSIEDATAYCRTNQNDNCCKSDALG